MQAARPNPHPRSPNCVSSLPPGRLFFGTRWICAAAWSCPSPAETHWPLRSSLGLPVARNSRAGVTSEWEKTILNQALVLKSDDRLRRLIFFSTFFFISENKAANIVNLESTRENNVEWNVSEFYLFIQFFHDLVDLGVWCPGGEKSSLKLNHYSKDTSYSL